MKNQVKTWNSQQSNVDVFSKLENNFLQKFFKYIMADYFEDYFSNVYESKILKKIADKNTKILSQDLFIAQKMVSAEQLELMLKSFYTEKSTEFYPDDLNIIFQLKHFNRPPDQRVIMQGELILVDVKIKVDNQKIQQMPTRMENIIHLFNEKLRVEGDGEKCVRSILENYKGQFFNFFVIYYGDTNFQIIKKRNFQIQSIQILGKTYKLRIFTFFVSKIALVDTFKKINKISSLDYINDLVIQFYELKRQKHRRKKLKHLRAETDQMDKKANSAQMASIRNAIVGLGIAVGVSYVLIKKIFA